MIFPNANSEKELQQEIAQTEYYCRKGSLPGASATFLPDNKQRWELNDKLLALEKIYSGEKLRNSFAGKMGRAIEPAISPLGFDWRMGIGIVASFAAREVFVSTMSTVYNVGNDASEEGTKNLKQTLREQKRSDGSPVYTTMTALSLMVFYVFALQCVSTVAVVRRETNSWKWPLFQWAYMGGLAWVFAFAVYRLGHLFGWH